MCKFVRLLVPWDSVTHDLMPVVGPHDDELAKVLQMGAESTFGNCIGVQAELSNTLALYKMMQNESERYETHEPAFYYHTDHLGSTSRFTDDSGRVVQTLAYMPYGEDWVDDSKFLYTDTNHIGIYQFNGKERDFESGFYYYGARYHWPELWTGWTTPDPLMDKYPGISPYNYCTWNPVIFVDPDGRDTFNIDLSRGRISQTIADGNHSVRFWRDNKLLMDRTINDIGSNISFLPCSFPKDYKEKGYTHYLIFENTELGWEVFNIIQVESAFYNEAKEWDYYSMSSGGELSSSGIEDNMVHDINRYTKDNVKSWHHFHPNTNSMGWYPSKTDQQRAIDLMCPSYLYFQGEFKRFDIYLHDRILSPSDYGTQTGFYK